MNATSDFKNIWVIVETECGKVKSVGLELLNAGRALLRYGEELIAVLIGKGVLVFLLLLRRKLLVCNALGHKL